MSLQSAADAMLHELVALSKWEQDLTADLAATRGRAFELRKSIEALVRCLPIADRRAIRADIARLELPLRKIRRAAGPLSDRVAAVHAYLAAADDVVTVKDVQAHLVKHGLASAANSAAIILARKATQGMVERFGRGRYRVIPSHPEIQARRMLSD